MAVHLIWAHLQISHNLASAPQKKKHFYFSYIIFIIHVIHVCSLPTYLGGGCIYFQKSDIAIFSMCSDRVVCLACSAAMMHMCTYQYHCNLAI